VLYICAVYVYCMCVVYMCAVDVCCICVLYTCSVYACCICVLYTCIVYVYCICVLYMRTVYVYCMSPAKIVGSNLTGEWMFVCCGCCVLSGIGLCHELLTRPEESYRLWCVVVCDLETSRMRRP
jgi:hypothetical protein